MSTIASIAIVGYGVEGQAALRYWSQHAQAAKITVLDQKADITLPKGVGSQLGNDYLKQLDRFDLIVRSPGVSMNDIVAANPRIDLEAKITSGTREFLARCPNKVIGVTGTKGKGTTATLIASMLEAAGKTVHLGGNIGRPAIELLANIKPNDYIVLELSSYQLSDVTKSPHIAVGLMISNDHTAFHGTKAEYVDAKANLFRFQSPEDIAVYNVMNPDSAHIATFSLGEKRPYFNGAWAHITDGSIWLGERQICSVREVGLLGPHNLENIAAALNAVATIVADDEVLRSVVKQFKGLPHRLEPVGTVNKRQFVNDSFATVPEATIAALHSFTEPKVLIIGGMDRGMDYSPVASEIKESNVRSVILVGQLTQQLEKLFKDVGFKNYTSGFTEMDQIVTAALKASKPGDVIVLSPGAPSFDMFRDYKDRGDQFRTTVKNLSPH